MKEYPLVPLGTLISQAKKVRCGEEDYPVLSMTMHNGLIFQDKKFKKVIASQDRSNYKVVYRNQLVISFPIDEGVLAAQRITDAGIVSPAYGIWDIDQEKILPEFLECALRCERALNYYKSKLRGSTARRRSLPTSTLLAFNVPLPSISEQLNVLAIVHKLKSVIDTRKEEINVLDKLVKARFVEMFEGGENQWGQKKLVECCNNKNDIKCGPFGSQLHVEDYQNVGIPVYGIPEVNSGFKTNPKLYVSRLKAEELSSYNLIPGDVAVSRKGNVGQAALFHDELKNGIIHSDVLRIRLNEQILNPLFLIGELHFSQGIRNQVMQASNGAIMPGTNVTKLKKIIIDVPPLSMQMKYSTLVQQVEKSKVAIDHGVILIRKALQSGYHNVWGN